MSTGITTHRLSQQEYRDNFSDLHPPLNEMRAKIDADRCYFCHDAPCMDACPTSIDIPMFIREIAAKNPAGAAQTIFDSNILGGMCARVCPTETLCEEVCVHVAQGNLPIKIGQLQRYATDHAMQNGTARFDRAEISGRRVAIVGAGPAGLSCAHNLARLGHAVTILEARAKPGGLNEFGLAAYKTVGGFAQAEIEFILSFGGIEIEYGKSLGHDVTLEQLTNDYDAVFLGLGLGNVNNLGTDGDELEGVNDAVSYIAELRQAGDLAELQVGERIVVIGGGMTAIDIAVQTKKLGAREVTICYRRGPEQMGASAYERELAQTNGVNIVNWAAPKTVDGNGAVSSIAFERTELDASGKLKSTGETFTLAADQVFKAIGQKLDGMGLSGIEMRAGRIQADENSKTSLVNVWAGGDCIAGGNDLTVSSVEDGKIAARAINEFLGGKK